jgi:ABC-type lipoprotein release transport system permease subunit
MSLVYPVKHVFRNWKLFAALLIGVALAATFLAGIGVKADVAAEQALDMQLSSMKTDMDFTIALNRTNVPLVMRDISSFSGVKSVEVLTRCYLPTLNVTNSNYTCSQVNMLSFPNSSRINDEWLNKPENGIAKDHVYVVAGNQLAGRVSVGDIINVQITFPQPKYSRERVIDVNLTVAGFVEFTDDGYAYSANNLWPGSYGAYRQDMLIIGWDSTFMKMWESVTEGTAQIQFFIDVDHEEFISPYSIDMSVIKLNQLSDNIQNHIVGKYVAFGWVNNILSQVLSSHNNSFQNMFLDIILLTFPIFFVSWYLGSTVSTVSFNIRRREIGLLSTKGLSSGQIQRMFLAEAMIIGAVGGLLGVIGGLILNQYYAGAVNLGSLFSSEMFNPMIAVAVLIFAVILAVTSVFWSSRKASQIPAVEALRNYLPEDKPSRKIFPIIALILGCYKIAVFLLNVNISQLLYQLMYSNGNMLLYSLTNSLITFDNIMTIVGPLLFFYGFTTLLIRDSTIFQTVATKISSFMGELGALAAKNVRRSPKRLVAIAFMIAIIIGLSVQVTIQISSREDFVVRNVHYSVGADVAVNVVNASRSQEILQNITQNVVGISGASIEHSLPAVSLNDRAASWTIRTIEPDKWAASAYYEGSWFTGGPSVDQMLSDLKKNNNTIILDRSLAKQFDLNLYDEITVVFITGTRQLQIVGFVGHEPSDDMYFGRSFNYAGLYHSYVPRHLFNMTEGSIIYVAEDLSTQILLNLEPGVNGAEVARQIRNLDLEIRDVISFDEQWQESLERNNFNTYNDQLVMELQSFGLIFAVISASLGTALIAMVSLKERDREATLMSVRGLSYRQLVWMFLVESLAIITFAVILGGIVGLIMAYGSVVVDNTGSFIPLVTQRLVFPPNTFVVLGTYVALIYASTIGAILIMTSKYVTKLEKMVRAK